MDSTELVGRMTPRQVMDTLLMMGFVDETAKHLEEIWRHKLCHDPLNRGIVVFVCETDSTGGEDYSIHTDGETNPRFIDGRSFIEAVQRRLEESANG